MGPPNNSSTTQSTSATTNTVTDSFNQSLSRVESLSNVGNVRLEFGEGAGGFSPTTLIVIFGGLIGLVFVFRKK